MAANSINGATGACGQRHGTPNSRASAGRPIQGVRSTNTNPNQPIISPRPSWRPAVTDFGMSLATQPINPLAPSTSRTAPMMSPAAAVGSGVSCPVRRTAETAFVG